MAHVATAESEPIGQIEDSMPVKLFSCAFGAMLAVVGDLMNNGSAALVIKLREVLKVNIHPNFEETYMVVLLILAVALCLFVVRTPKGKVEAFAQGLAVFAAITTLSPLKQVPASTEISLARTAPASISSLLISSAEAAPVAEVYRRSVNVVFDGGRPPAPGARVIVRDERTGAAVGQKALNDVRNDVTITAPRGSYLLDVEAAGFERTRARVAIAGPMDPPQTIQIRRSSVPLPIQQLYRPNTAWPR